jgi:hypothetical protein
MCEKIMQRLKANSFAYLYEHRPVEGGHAEPLKHFDAILTFLNANFKST